MHRRSRSLNLLALTAVSGLALAGCSTAATDDVPAAQAAFDPDQSYEIVFESYNLGSAQWEGPILGLVEQFEDEHPNISVVTQASGDSTAAGGTAASVQRQLLAGSPPDVVQMTFDTLGYAATDLQAQPLDEIVGEEAIAEHFEGEYPMHEKVRDFGLLDGSLYGIPYVLSTPILFYNATALEEAGITDPDFSTWETLAEIAAITTEHTGSPSFSNSCLDPVGEWCYQSMVRSAGGQVLSDDRSTVMAGEPEAVAPIAAMQELYDDGVLQNADFSGQYEAFAGGQTLMHVNSASMQAVFEAGAADGGWELAAAPIPGMEGRDVVPVSSGSMLSIFSQDAGQQAAAWEFVQFMTSPAAYEVITPEIGYLPLRTTMTEGDGPLAAWAQQQAGLLAPNLAQLDAIEPWTAYPGKNYVQMSTVIMDAVEQVVYQGADPESTLAAAQERAQAQVEQ